ncbi:hypothetical protein HOU00_gp342 [Caulobacter phage CcrPW]|uniref:Uncharacterized protein n=1 Tax=Caulobacter phage CcrPW TaxID=2283271 RepID=A0A385EAG0_9CAUD|nr:hypothetical protein HOU00_gp342 [Caulobacter phage CcrPW]AXQ68783.1 hypothetical protein CcrPW_gp244 [Caulobacter phage CcrPW]
MPLSEEEALLIRDGDIVLVPIKVMRSNNHFDRDGVSLRVQSPQILHGRDEIEKGQPEFSIKTSQVHSIAAMPLRLKDHVKWDASGPGAEYMPETGVVVHIDGDDITVKQDKERTPRNRVILRRALTRYNPKLKEA